MCCSVSVLQMGQVYMAWRVAPRKLSKQLPTMPLKSARRGVNASDLRKPSPAQIKKPREHAPRADAAIPKSVTPPEVPGATGLPFVIKRGDALLSVPSSVAQVSAVAVAIAPMKAVFARRRVLGDREKPKHSAKNVASPPLATACERSRRDPLLNLSEATRAFSRVRKEESRLDEKKTSTSESPHDQPPMPTTLVPQTIAPSTPLLSSDLRR